MSHGIMGLDKPVYGSNTSAWHGLGETRPGQFQTAVEAVMYALNWLVGVEPMYTQGGLVVPGVNVTVRQDLEHTDSRRILGVVGDVWQSIQNIDAAELLDAFAGLTGCRIETIGSLRNGATIWILAEMPEVLKVKDDTIKRYIILRMGHDGSTALEMYFTDVRVVCQNTLNLAVKGSPCKVKVKHSGKSQQRMAEIRGAAIRSAEHFQKMGHLFNSLSDVRMTPKGAADFLKVLVADDKDDSKETLNSKNVKRLQIATLWDGGQRGGAQEAVRGTAYGMLQAVGEYADHYATVRRTNGASTSAARMESVLWGSAANFKQDALDKLLAGIDLDGTSNNGNVAALMDQFTVN